MSGTKIGEWERDKMCRFCLLAGDEEPYVWDFGSAAVHHKEYCDWLDPDRMLAGVVGMRGTIPPSFGLMKNTLKIFIAYSKNLVWQTCPLVSIMQKLQCFLH